METQLLYKSSFIDKALLVLVVAAIFFEPLLPFFNGSSTTFFLFIFVATYVSFAKGEAMVKIVKSKYFLVTILFTIVCTIMESIHQYQDYTCIVRFINMGLAVFTVSLLCRDREALAITINTFIICSALKSIYLISGPLGYLRAFSAEGFNDSSKARIQAFSEFSMRDYLNDISIFSAIGALFGIISLVYEKIRWRKVLYIVLVLLSIIGIFLPASRTGALIFIVGLFIFGYKSKLKFKSLIIPVVILATVIIFIVPDVVWVRIGSIDQFGELHGEDSRVKLYGAILSNIDQYALTGVGSGHYWKDWAVKTGITNIADAYVPMAPHNAFFQVWIFWGLPGLLSFLFMMYVFSTAARRNISNNSLKACLYIFMVLIPVVFLFYSNYYHKAFAVGVGLMLASRFWNIFSDEQVEEETLQEESMIEYGA